MVHDVISDTGYPTGSSPCHRLCLRGRTQSKDLFSRLQLRETSLNSSSLIWGWIFSSSLEKKALHFFCKANPKWVLVTVQRILSLIIFWPLQPHREILTAKASLQFSTFSKSIKYVRTKGSFAKTEVCCQLNKSWTAMSGYRATQFCQFSPAHYGMLACVGDLSIMGRPHFQGQTEGLLGWGQRWMSPSKDWLFSREHLWPWAAQGSCWVWSSEQHLQIRPGSKSRISLGLPIPTYLLGKVWHRELGEIRSWHV